MLLSGDPVTAAEAHRIGLVNAVVPQAELMEHCRAWLGKVLANGPAALALVMDAVDAGLESGLEAGLRYRSGGLRHERGDGRLQRRNARVSGEAARGIYREVRYGEGI